MEIIVCFISAVVTYIQLATVLSIKFLFLLKNNHLRSYFMYVQ